MVRRLTMLLLVLMFFVVGAAYGQSTFWVGSVYNDDVGAKVPDVMNFDWASSGSGNAQGGTSLAPGQTFTFRYQSYLFALNNAAGQVVNFPGLNTGFEYTAVAEIPMVVAAYDAVSRNYIFRTLQGGRFYMYHDSQRNAVVASGYGFDDGDLVVSGTIDADQFVSLVFTSPTKAIGSTILNGQVLSAAAAYLDPAPSIVSFRFESTVNFPPLDSTTTAYFAGRADQGNLPMYSVTGSDLALKVDASTKFMVEALRPEISVAKVCTDAPAYGQPITFSAKVKNTGTEPLTNITCVDTPTADLTGVPSSLDPGQEVTVTGSYMPTSIPSTDTLTCSGSGATSGTAVSASSSATCTVNLMTDLTVEKQCVDAPQPGAAIVFMATLTNSGNEPLINVSCTDDPNVPLTGVPIAELAPGSMATVSGSYVPVSSGSTDTITCSGTGILSQTVLTKASSATCNIITHPCINITKSCVDASGPGQPITFTGMVTNCGDVALEEIFVVDDHAGPVLSLTSLAPGASVSYSGSYVATTSPATNTVTVTGTDAINGGSYSAQASATCNVACTGEIGNFVWFDANANGIQDAGENGIAGATVNVYDSTGTSLIPGQPTIITPASGAYLFSGLCQGTYVVKVVSPVGYIASPSFQGGDVTKDSNGSPATVILPADDSSNLTIDFGYYATATIGDRVWNDANQNGQQDDGEMGIAGVTVRLVDCATDLVVATTATDVNGLYSFTGLMPGSYRVEFVAPTGYTFTMPNVGNDASDSDAGANGVTGCYTLVAGQTNTTVDAGLYVMPATIGDRVWNDANQNGQQDDGEMGIAGVTVRLVDCATDLVVATTATDVNGLYSFTGLMPGSYRVEFVAPTGYTFTMPNVGNDASDSDANAAGVTGCYTLVAGQTNTTVDAGLYKPMPSIDIEKYTNGADADMPTGPKIPVGGVVEWKYVVTNTGNVDLANVVVTDDKLGTICTIGPLAAGASQTCTKTGTAVMGQYANMGTVTGQYNGNTVTDQDPSHYYGVKASIDIEKYTNGDDADMPTGPKIPVGGMVEWKYVVTNTGNVELTGVAVTDDKLGAISCPKTVLAPTESMTCITTGTAVMGQYANMGTVTGQYNGTTVTDKDPSHYYGIPACVPCKDGVTWMQLKLDFHQYPSYAPNDRIRVRADSLTGDILYDSKYDSVSTTGLPVGAIFSFNVPPSAKTVVVTVQGKYHTYETVKATFSAECELLIGTISGNTYIKFKVMDANFDGELSCTPKTPDIDVEKYVSNDGGKTWHDADDAPGLSVPLCSQAPPPPPEPTCGACSGGITELTLLYKGSKSVKVVVKDSKGNQLYSNTVYPNKTFTVKGSGTMGSYIKIYIGSTVNTTIYTDCSKSIYPGMTSGSFTVASGSSKNGGELCDKTSTSASPSYSSSSSTTTSWWWSSSSYSSYTKDDDDDDRNSYDGSDYDKAYSDSCGTIPVYPSCKVQFKFVVKNTGNTDLTNIILTDDVYNLSGTCTIPASLAPGASFSCTIGPFAAEAGQHTNTATVTGKYNGFEVSDSDKANYYGGKPATGCVRSPGYWKTHPEAWPVQTIVIGDVTYSKSEAIILMEKPVAGDKTFTLFPALVSAKLNVLSGADASCISDVIASADSWMANYPVGSGVTGSSPAWDTAEPLYMKLDKYNNGYLCASYCGDQNPPPTSYPKISIDKYTNGYDADMAPGPYIWIGDQVKWTYVVKNTGNTTLTGIEVTDDKVSTINCPKSSLMSGESMTCTATGIAVEGQYENTGCVVGYASGNIKVSDCDLSHYYGKEKQTQTSCGTGTPGYWKNHPEAWPVSSITIGGTSYSKDQAISIMAKSVSGDKTYTMFPALVSAKLNVMVGNNSSCISSTITAADAWMKTYKLSRGVAGSSSAWKQGEPYYWALDNYNNGLLCAPHRDSSSSSCSSSVPSEWFN